MSDKQDNPLRTKILGTWRMHAWTRRVVDTGELTDALGPHPFGFINYSADGRVMVFVLKSGRLVPASSRPTNEEKIALFDSMFAYVGTYVVESDRVIHTLDGSWNELWTGTQQIRFITLQGAQLVYRTPETIDPMDGRLCTYEVTFSRE
ncbi:lipocalin-like domain-containing protein [Paraburkholderia sp. A1RI-2L]|uniref:lipocalin-like domain-containing protein n=1 Tax=Paraburkholderia sp. A1RI-2L TaxID=3028367 RepID=UPI003B7F44C1